MFLGFGFFFVYSNTGLLLLVSSCVSNYGMLQ